MRLSLKALAGTKVTRPKRFKTYSNLKSDFDFTEVNVFGFKWSDKLAAYKKVSPISSSQQMNLQIASDLHLEMLQNAFPGERVISPAPEADLLVLAGDIAGGTSALRLFSDWPVPVLYVPGNHEFYGYNIARTSRDLDQVGLNGSVLVLQATKADFTRFEDWHARHAQELSRLRFLGATLWTDYRLPDLNKTQSQQMAAAQYAMADHSRIRTDNGYFTSQDALKRHTLEREWLQTQLKGPFEGTTIVVTHHGPLKDSTHPRWAGNPINGGFMSHMPELVEKADLWVHGHVHDTFDYMAGRCRVVANPRGYARNPRSAGKLSAVEWENPFFRHAFVVTV